MNQRFYEIYDAVLEGIPDGIRVLNRCCGEWWTAVETEQSLGIAMTTPGNTRPPLLDAHREADLRRLAGAVKSWNFSEAGFGMAAVNAFWNTEENLARLHAAEPFEAYCTAGLDLRGKRIGVVGHMKMPEFVAAQAGELFYLERNPRPGDFPDSACDALLPGCDLVLITGSSLVNKTLPHLLELCRDSYTILAGPTVPMCPALLSCGVDRLAGMIVTDRAGMKAQIDGNRGCSSYCHGTPFLLRREGAR